MRVIGLDPSLSSYGWCILDAETDDSISVVDRGRFMTGAHWIEIQRYLHLRACLREVVLRYQPRAAGLETPYFGGSYSEGLYALFVTNQEVLYRNGIDTVYFAPTQLKKLAMDDPKRTGKVFKSDMINAAKTTSGIAVWNADEADAFHASRFGARFWHLVSDDIKEKDLSKVEESVFLNRHSFIRGKKAGITEENGIFFKKMKRWFPFSRLGVHNGI